MIDSRTYATVDTLNGQVEFDSTFTVLPADADGNVEITDGPAGVYPPDVTDVHEPADLHDDRWELLTGYSGQQSYAGPIMHDSEYLGGRMARDVLATPGTYVLVSADYTCSDEEHADGTPVTDEDPRYTFTDEAGETHTTYVDHGECETYAEGWALARLRDDRPMSWGEVADRSAAGLCPASHGYAEPHIVTDGATCDECGATV